MNQRIKEFDSVELMRRLRDQLSEEMAQMSPQERMEYIRRRAEASPLGAHFGPQVRTRKAERVRVDG